MPSREPDGSEPDVLGNLPRARPTRRSAKRAGSAGEGAAPVREAATTRSRSPRAPAKPRQPRRRAAPAAAAPIPKAGYATPRREAERRARRHGLLGTALQAVGELVELGLTVGAQALKGALGRLPRP